MFQSLIFALAAAGLTSSQPAAPYRAGSATVARDSVVAWIIHRDSTSQLTLTTRSLVFEFTRAGVDRARERADSSLNARRESAGYADSWLASVVRNSVTGALRGIHVEFRLEDIQAVDVDDATIVFTFKPSAHDRNSDNTFEFDAVDAATAQRFAERVNALIRERR